MEPVKWAGGVGTKASGGPTPRTAEAVAAQLQLMVALPGFLLLKKMEKFKFSCGIFPLLNVSQKD